MGLRIEPHAEPIPGYRLIERLGGGGFGEVWKAEAPGGLFKAIKFVYGEISIDDSIVIDDPDGSRAKQELKSLCRVKTVHHPYILSLERFEIIQGQLVIVMELADKTLWDRFKECRAQGLPGIPREELLSYMEETAEALDLMNTEYQLQHLDIKPQNIFLVFNHVKVADFGLVKDLANQQNATITGGVTPVYAAPETFDGWLSRQSDQYSLAIVYQELLTGQRPFAGSSMKQLILHHLQSAPDLSQLPVADRPIVGKALAKNPDDRYPGCLDFIRLLKTPLGVKALHPWPESKTAAPTDAKHAMPNSTSAPMDTTSNHTADARGNAGPVKPADPNFSTEDAFNGQRPQILPPRPERLTDEESRAAGLGAPEQEAAGPNLDGILQPALIIGLGKLGGEAVAQLRRRLVEDFGPPEALPELRIVAIDTDAESMAQLTTDPARPPLSGQEVLLTRLQRPSHYVKAREGKTSDKWLNPKLIYRIPREQNNAGLRALGRLALVDNYRAIAKRLEGELAAATSSFAGHDSASTKDLGLRSRTPRVYIVASLTGNTGSGMFIDVAYLVRKLLRAQGHDHAEITGLFFVPRVRRDGASAPALVNTFASLVELHHFSQLDSLFNARYESTTSSGKDAVSESGPAFQRCILLELPEMRGSGSGENVAAVVQAGDFLCRDLTTELGAAIDKQRREKMSLSNEWQLGKLPLLQSIGMYRIFWPRHALLKECARRLCCQLVSRWMSKDAKGMAATIQPWTHECWESLGMRPENLIERFQKLSEQALQKGPEQMLTEILGPLHESLCGAGKDPDGINLGPVVQAMDRLETTVGSPEENRTAAGQAEPSLLERTLIDIAHVISDQCEEKLAELAVTLLEDPNYRLAGAEEALRQFCTTVDQALQSQETLAKELTESARMLHERILQLLESHLKNGSTTKVTLKITRKASGKTPSARDVFELLRTYAKTRYHSLVLTHLNRLYLSVRGHLSDQIREVGFCRQRLAELLGLLQPVGGAALNKNAAANPAERVLFPPGCLAMSDALDKLSQESTPADLVRFDERIQTWIVANCQALLQVCMGSSTLVKNVAPAILREAEAFLDGRSRGNSIAEMYLARKRGEAESGGQDAIGDDLEQCFEEAVPDLGRLSELNEIAVACLPNDAHGQEVQQILARRFPDLKVLLTERKDEMIFYREIINLPWRELEQMGPIAQEAYEKRCAGDPSSVHSREDIAEWQSPLALVRR